MFAQVKLAQKRICMYDVCASFTCANILQQIRFFASFSQRPAQPAASAASLSSPELNPVSV
jgi:hypothetical protein